MEVALRDCPACQAVIMGTETHCADCGAELPPLPAPVIPVAPVATSFIAEEKRANEEVPCSNCGMMLPPGVLRCRDCGTYISLEVEQAAMAKMASRMYAGMGGGGFLGAGAPFGGGFSQPGFSSVADDDDFDLNPEISMGESQIIPVFDPGQFELEIPEIPSDTETPPVAEADYSVNEPAQVADIPIAEAPSAAAVSTDPAAIPVAGAPTNNAIEAPNAEEEAAQRAGESLLNTALEEQVEAADRAKLGRRRVRSQTTVLAPGRFLVFCPKGHRIQVQDKHRGRTGRCPNCKTMFFVPTAETSQISGEAGAPSANPVDAVPAEPAVPAPGYTRWITDVQLNLVVPQKLKLKADSLLLEALPVDLGLAGDHIFVAVLFKGSGPFKAMQEPKAKVANRKLLLEHLATNKAMVELNLPGQYTIPRAQLPMLRLAQPTMPGEESMFADVPVFGVGRIGVRVQSLDTATERAYLNFTLSQFRDFSQALGDQYALSDFGAGTSIPMQDDFQQHKCHYSEAVLNAISEAQLPYYQADTARKPVVLGHKCQRCGIVVSEDSRKKEKIGGKAPDSVAKAKCPKCKEKMGKHILYGYAGSAES